MTHARRYKYPPQLPASLKETGARLAKEDGVSLSQWIVAAVSPEDRRGRDHGGFPARAGGARARGRSGRYLETAPDAAPGPGAELPE